MENLTIKEIDKLLLDKNNEIDKMDNELAKRFVNTLLDTLSEDQLKMFMIIFNINDIKDKEFNKFFHHHLFYSMINKITVICQLKAQNEL